MLENFILREKITHFDHERIPERTKLLCLYRALRLIACGHKASTLHALFTDCVM
ncbi:catalase [Dyella sp. 7MK23]|uniref:Catalase n=1 Tax=Dyella acidiphila TaxID=2775866 RepID=A0ABR9GCM3_9GAMM|nr:catalase [Dyella acidiphila]